MMATGFARGAKDRGKQIAFGDGKQIIWDQHSPIVFKNNPNVAKPGSENDADVEWVRFHKGHRVYNKHDVINQRWIWNYEFRATPGEMFFSEEELAVGGTHGEGYVIVEPNVPRHKSVAPNKQWPFARYATVAEKLMRQGLRVRQFVYPGANLLPGVKTLKSPSFRHALAFMKNASLYIGPEGGLHHGAAAVGTSAVVLFGGFIPPAITGYDSHTNLTGGVKACGSLRRCAHCMRAMDAIPISEVFDAAMRYVEEKK